MGETTGVEEVKRVLSTFFQGLGSQDEATIRRVWHPDARLFLNNAVLNAKPLIFLLSLPESMGFEIRDIGYVDVQGGIATARVDYGLSIGTHSGFFNLVKDGGRWFIANWVDHGASRPFISSDAESAVEQAAD
jgi:hypothetical protein